jgi:hypothetical protein
MMMTSSRMDTAQHLRSIVLFIMAFGVMGTVTELLLIGHYKALNQWPPLMLLGLTALGIIAMWQNPRPRLLRVFRWLMVVVAVSSFVGVYFHLQGNIAFKLETNPDLSWLLLLWKALESGIPVLAPGMMAQIGLLGLAYTFRHPNLHTQKNLVERKVLETSL